MSVSTSRAPAVRRSRSSLLTPARTRGFEYLDDPTLPPEIAERSLQDVALSNRLFGGTNAVLKSVREELRRAHREGVNALSVLDVGTGLADVPQAISVLSKAYSIRVTSIGLEISHALSRLADRRQIAAVTGDARTLPFADRSIDIVTCSQVLHHFADDDARAMLAECSRVARRAVIVADLRRSYLAMALLWLVSFPLRFHAISRHDGVASIRRGFTTAELDLAVRASGARNPRTRHRLGWRVTAVWNPGTNTP